MDLTLARRSRRVTHGRRSGRGEKNAATWDAVHATPVTIVLQTAAGALVGGAFIGAAALYWSMRQGPARATLAPQRVRAGSPDWAVPREGRAAPADIRYGVRHVFVMLFGLGLLAAGGVILLACLRHPTVYGLARGGFGAVFLLGLGGYLLWDDFVAPHLRGAKTVDSHFVFPGLPYRSGRHLRDQKTHPQAGLRVTP